MELPSFAGSDKDPHSPRMKKNFLGELPLASGRMVQEKVSGR